MKYFVFCSFSFQLAACNKDFLYQSVNLTKKLTPTVVTSDVKLRKTVIVAFAVKTYN